MSDHTVEWQVGQRVRVTKQVARQQRVFTAAAEGVIEKHEQRKTGSWFAHSKDDKLWLDRLVIRKDDGELYIANLDSQTRVEVLGGGQTEGGTDAG